MLPPPRSHQRARPSLRNVHTKAAPIGGEPACFGLAASAGYVRERDLPRLIAIWPNDLRQRTAAGQAAIVRRLHNALRAERRRGLAGHWTYDLARHTQILTAYRAEAAALTAIAANTPPTPPPQSKRHPG